MYILSNIENEVVDRERAYYLNPVYCVFILYLLADLDKVRMIVTPKVHFLSFLVGISSGILYGIINSSRYTIEKYSLCDKDSNHWEINTL